MTFVLVILGGAVGAPLRYLADRAIQARHGSAFPWGTLAVNVAGSLLLGGLAGAGSALPTAVGALVGTGFCGALTTFSTLSYETLRLAQSGAWWSATVNVAVSLMAGLGAMELGFAAGAGVF